MSVWELIRESAERLPIGAQVQTSLLGRVGAETVHSEWLPVIPQHIQQAAYKHGFRVVDADPTRNIYTLQIIAKHGGKAK